MPEYTIEEVMLLNNMIDLRKIILTSDRTMKMHINDDASLSLFKNSDIKNEEPRGVLWEIIRTVFSDPGDSRTSLEAHKIIFEEPFKRMPLHINRPDNLRILAQWRLEIGK